MLLLCSNGQKQDYSGLHSVTEPLTFHTYVSALHYSLMNVDFYPV